MIHRGFSYARIKLAFNTTEKAFYRAWLGEHPSGYNRSIIGNIIPEVTQRDATVAATIIQWLGSNCGSYFVADVINKCPQFRRYICQSCNLTETPKREVKS